MKAYLIYIKIAVIVGLIVGAYFFGHHVANLADAKAQQAAVIAAQNAQHAEDMKQLATAAANAQAAGVDEGKREAAQQANTQNFQVITRTVTKYVHDHPQIQHCGLDADGLRLWNAANAGALPAAAATIHQPGRAEGLPKPSASH